jgi:hypothetical protein
VAAALAGGGERRRARARCNFPGDVVRVEAAFQWVFTRSGTRVNRVSDSKQVASGLGSNLVPGFET